MDTPTKETPEHAKWRKGYTLWLWIRIGVGIAAVILIILSVIFH